MKPRKGRSKCFGLFYCSSLTNLKITAGLLQPESLDMSELFGAYVPPQAMDVTSTSGSKYSGSVSQWYE
jgi:hypothetical protein